MTRENMPLKEKKLFPRFVGVIKKIFIIFQTFYWFLKDRQLELIDTSVISSLVNPRFPTSEVSTNQK